MFVVRHRRKYYVTNRLDLSAKEVHTLYRKRQAVEEVIRVLKSQLSLEGCQAGYKRSFAESSPLREGAQEHHIAMRLVAYLLVERERLDHGDTWRQRKRQLILTGPQGVLPALERVRRARKFCCSETPVTDEFMATWRAALVLSDMPALATRPQTRPQTLERLRDLLMAFPGVQSRS